MYKLPKNTTICCADFDKTTRYCIMVIENVWLIYLKVNKCKNDYLQTEKEIDGMKIIKRSGEEQVFDSAKIIQAISKANLSVEPKQRLSSEKIAEIADYIEYKCKKTKRAFNVEEIQDLVENQLMSIGAHELARNYITYRYTRALARQNNTTDKQILSLIDCNNEEVKQENSNKNPTINSEMRIIIFTPIFKPLRTILKPIFKYKQGSF